MPSVFEKDLEFVQLLCNPDYIKWLYNRGFFADAAFKAYLRHLLYFKSPDYCKYLLYPQCVPIVERLLADGILDELANNTFYEQLSEEQFYLWKARAS
ncbi:mediator of RNA polymerase II transcription subunit 31 [Pancytospora philotis]|nr:mediator of RNA polymerase II transcription subunit 31 [Pancytospora philotis]